MTPIDLRVAGLAGRPPVLLGLAGRQRVRQEHAVPRASSTSWASSAWGGSAPTTTTATTARRAPRSGVTPLAPEANRMDLMAAHLRALAAGAAVTKPTYDHHTGTFGPSETVEPGEIVIVEGLLPLADRGTRDAIDVAVYLEPEEILRRRWKLERDVFERGYSPQRGRGRDQSPRGRRRRVHPAAAGLRRHRRRGSIAARAPRTTSTCPPGSWCGPRCRTPGSASWSGSLRRRGLEPIRWSTRDRPAGPDERAGHRRQLPAGPGRGDSRT